MTIFQRCRKVVTDSFGLEKATELVRHRTTERQYILLILATVNLRTSITGAAPAGMGSTWGRHHG